MYKFNVFHKIHASKITISMLPRNDKDHCSLVSMATVQIGFCENHLKTKLMRFQLGIYLYTTYV